METTKLTGEWIDSVVDELGADADIWREPSGRYVAVSAGADVSEELHEEAEWQGRAFEMAEEIAAQE